MRTDSCRDAQELEAAYPGLRIWYGRHTGRWWATHPAVPYLVDAPHPAQLATRLDAALPRRPRARYGRRK
jgi:hypothetical protein